MNRKDKYENFEDLVKGILSGDKDAEYEFYNRFYSWIESIVYKRFKDSGSKGLPDASSLTNDILFKVILAIRSGKFDLSKVNSLEGFVLKTAKLKISDTFSNLKKRLIFFNKINPLPENEFSEIPDSLKTVIDEFRLDTEKRHQLLHRCIQELPQNQKQVIQDSLEGLKQKETQSKLKLEKVSQVTNLKKSAIKRLEKCLKKMGTW